MFRRQLLHIPLSCSPGHETKALLNNSGPRYKRSKLERQMNCDVLWCVLLLVCMSLFSAVGKSPNMSPPTPPWSRLLDSLKEGLGAGIILTLLDPAPERSNAPFHWCGSQECLHQHHCGHSEADGLWRVRFLSELIIAWMGEWIHSSDSTLSSEETARVMNQVNSNRRGTYMPLWLYRNRKRPFVS